MNSASPYATPREVTNLADCLFYHTTDLPGHGTLSGPWDLRPGIERYLGGASFKGKRILDVGAASGFLSFYMERQGGEVVSYDLSDEHCWDNVPFAATDIQAVDAATRAGIRKVNNSYWYAHRAWRSKNRVVHGTVYEIPTTLGSFDIGVFGSILEHLRDPFLALQKGLVLVRETAIVTETIPRRRFWHRFVSPLLKPQMLFLPDAKKLAYGAVWWVLPPKIVQRFLAVLGFEDTTVTYHRQRYEGSTRLLYTVVARRTQPAAAIAERSEKNASQSAA